MKVTDRRIINLPPALIERKTTYHLVIMIYRETKNIDITLFCKQ